MEKPHGAMEGRGFHRMILVLECVPLHLSGESAFERWHQTRGRWTFCPEVNECTVNILFTAQSISLLPNISEGPLSSYLYL